MDSFVFYPNLLQIAETLTRDEDAIGRAMLAVVRYGAMGIDYAGSDSVVSAVMFAARPLIDSAKGKRERKRGPKPGSHNNPNGRRGKLAIEEVDTIDEVDEMDKELKRTNSELIQELKKTNSRTNSELIQNLQNADNESVITKKTNSGTKKTPRAYNVDVNCNVNVNGDFKKEGTIVPKKESLSAPKESDGSLPLTLALDEPPREKTSYEKFKDFLADECPYVNAHLTLPTEAQFERLVNAYGSPMLADVCRDLENSRELRKKYVSLYRTAINWCKMRVAKNEQRQAIVR